MTKWALAQGWRNTGSEAGAGAWRTWRALSNSCTIGPCLFAPAMAHGRTLRCASTPRTNCPLPRRIVVPWLLPVHQSKRLYDAALHPAMRLRKGGGGLLTGSFPGVQVHACMVADTEGHNWTGNTPYGVTSLGLLECSFPLSFFLVTGLCAAATLIDGDGLDVCTYCTYMRYRVSESPKVAWPLPCRYHRWPRQCKLSLPECHCRNGLPEHSMFLADRSGLLMGFMFRNRASVADCEDSGAWPTRRIAPSRPSPLSRPSHRRPL